MPMLENKTGQGPFVGPETPWHIRACLHPAKPPSSPRQGAKRKHPWATPSPKLGLSLSESIHWHGSQPCWGDTNGKTITLPTPGQAWASQHPGAPWAPRGMK